jgi:hypothetical protein
MTVENPRRTIGLLGHPTLVLLLGSWLVLLPQAACGPQAPDEDAENDGFLVEGKADGAEEGSPLARAVLRVANECSLETLRDEVRLGSRVAENVVRARAGADRARGTGDDAPFTSLKQLDAVPYLGSKAFTRLVDFARSHGYVEGGNGTGGTAGPLPLTAQATRIPWSGYYWSMLNGELVRGWNDQNGRSEWSEKEVRDFDACLESYTDSCKQLLSTMTGERGVKLSPLMKFDWYVRLILERQYGPGGAPASSFTHAARWELDHHYIGENANHPYWESRYYAGKCIGWALSTLYYDEPTREGEIGGVLFKPADIKGFLASIYNGAQFFVPENMVVGNEYHDAAGQSTPENYEDVKPVDFVRALAATIAQGKILEGDLDPGDSVWNHPIHKYALSVKDARPGVVSVDATLHYANDVVGIDEVFSTNPARPDLLSQELTFELDVPEGWGGDLLKATGGRWTGVSVDQHPDVLIMGLEEKWREEIYEYRGTKMNNDVNFPLLKRAPGPGGTWVPLVDDLLARYYQK